MKTTIRIIASMFIILLLTSLSFSYTQAVKNEKCDGNLFGYQKQRCLKKFGAASIITAKDIVFKDISKNRYKKAIEYVQANKIVNGYKDKTFKPNNPINRAEFTKILILAKLKKDPPTPSESCFPDVSADVWFGKYVCYAKSSQILGGYPDGTFRPTNNINFAEAAKILSNTFSLPVAAAPEGQPWYMPYIDTLAQQKTIPGTILKHNYNITRAEMAEMIMRISTKDTSQASLTTCDLIPSTCSDTSKGFGDNLIKGVDMQVVRSEWLKWTNQAREQVGLFAYKYNNQLNRSAFTWADTMKEKGEVSHKRVGQTDFYNYDKIKAWFNDLNLDFENINRVTFSESIGAGPISCPADCTKTLTTAIKSTFAAYMAEKGTDDAAHYNSIMNKYFNEIGIGVALDKEKGKFYLTIHYGTKLK